MRCVCVCVLCCMWCGVGLIGAGGAEKGVWKRVEAPGAVQIDEDVHGGRTHCAGGHSAPVWLNLQPLHQSRPRGDRPRTEAQPQAMCPTGYS